LFQKFDVCRVEIHSINLETYNFLTQVYKLKLPIQDYLLQAQRILKLILKLLSDKVKVVGWFCMSAVGFRERVAGVIYEFDLNSYDKLNSSFLRLFYIHQYIALIQYYQHVQYSNVCISVKAFLI
jgi:hypothetical protein